MYFAAVLFFRESFSVVRGDVYDVHFKYYSMHIFLFILFHVSVLYSLFS